MKTPKPLLALRMVFPLAASLIVLLLGGDRPREPERERFASFIFPHIGAYLLAWLLLFLVWLLLDWVFRCPPLSTLGMAVLGCAPCAVNFTPCSCAASRSCHGIRHRCRRLPVWHPLRASRSSPAWS